MVVELECLLFCFELVLFELDLPYWFVFKTGASLVNRSSSPHVIIEPAVSMTQGNNKKIQTGKKSIKNIFAYDTSKHIAASTDAIS